MGNNTNKQTPSDVSVRLQVVQIGSCMYKTEKYNTGKYYTGTNISGKYNTGKISHRVIYFGKILQWKNYFKKLTLTFFIFTDLETC